MKDLKYIILVVILSVAVVFLFMDKCGSSGKLNQLKGEYKEYRKIIKVENQLKEGKIKEQQEKIETLNTTIEIRNTTIAIKKKSITGLGHEVADLEDEFSNLIDKDAKINNLTKQVEVWKEKFSLAQSIIADKDEIIFSLTAQYKAQLVISNEYKELYESMQPLVEMCTKINKAQSGQIKKLKFANGLKSGLVLLISGLLVYNMVK